MSIWNPENIKDVAESVGIPALPDDVVNHLCRDVEYRISIVLEEALKFMRHAKRTLLTTQDISSALRALDVEPLYGYDSTRPLRFGEASIGPGQPLYYVEDEEVDLEKLINAPLPKVPREVTFTAHWLAIEGVQPSIPQNPITSDSRASELAPKGAAATSTLAALSGDESASVKPLVKHILSKELQLYFDRVSHAVLDENNDEYRNAAFSSLTNDPGLHQLVPYFVSFIGEKVTHGLKNLFVLNQMMRFTQAILGNEKLFMDPYILALIPSVLTCVFGNRLGDTSSPPLAHFSLRDLSSSLIGLIARKYASSLHTLKGRLARSCLAQFLNPNRRLGAHYGAILALHALGGAETVKVLILPNLRGYESVIRGDLEGGMGARRQEAECVLGAIVRVLGSLEEGGREMANGTSGQGGEELRERLVEAVGEVVGNRVWELRRPRLARAIVEAMPKE